MQHLSVSTLRHRRGSSPRRPRAQGHLALLVPSHGRCRISLILSEGMSEDSLVRQERETNFLAAGRLGRDAPGEHLAESSASSLQPPAPSRISALPDLMQLAACRARFRLFFEHHRSVRTNPPHDEDHHVHVPVESCELPTGIQLVYADDRDRQRTVALEDAALLDFGQMKAFRRPPAYRGQGNFPGWWWSVTTRAHVAYESWLERHYIIEADRDIRVTGISRQPFQLPGPKGGSRYGMCPTCSAGCSRARVSLLIATAEQDRRGPPAKAAVTAAACGISAGTIAWPSSPIQYGRPTCDGCPATGTRASVTSNWRNCSSRSSLARSRSARPHGRQVIRSRSGRSCSSLLWRGRLSADLGRPLGETTVVTAVADPVEAA